MIATWRTMKSFGRWVRQTAPHSTLSVKLGLASLRIRTLPVKAGRVRARSRVERRYSAADGGTAWRISALCCPSLVLPGAMTSIRWPCRMRARCYAIWAACPAAESAPTGPRWPNWMPSLSTFAPCAIEVNNRSIR